MVPLNEVDRAILREIQHNGRATPGHFQNVVGKSRTYTSQRVTRLAEHGYIDEIAPNLYEITDSGQTKLAEANGKK